jgi:hypothetical protein
MASIDTTCLSLQDTFATRRGAKIAVLKAGDGECIYQPNEFLRVPFEPSTFDKDPTATNLNLVLETVPEVEEAIKQFDDWLIGYLTEHCERILKRQLTREQVAAGYTSPLRNSEKGYPATLKTKMSTAPGKHYIACWSRESHERGKFREPPENWRRFKVSPRLHISHLWIMGSQFGPLIRITDAMLEPRYDELVAPKERENPFK